MFAVSPARRGLRRGATSGCVLLPDTQIFRKRAPRGDARLGRALQVVRRPAHRGLRRPRGPRHREAARLRDEGGRGRHARLPVPRLPRRGPPLRAARADRQGLALHRPDAKAPALSKLGGKAWQLLKSRAREHRSASSPASCSQLYAQPPDVAGRSPTTVEREWLERLESRVPVPRDGGPARARSRRSRRTSRRAQPDGPARLRRRRLRQDRGRGPRGVRGRARTASRR